MAKSNHKFTLSLIVSAKMQKYLLKSCVYDKIMYTVAPDFITGKQK
jgi:hypothetical protein